MVVGVSHQWEGRCSGRVLTPGLLVDVLVVLQPIFWLNPEYLLQTSEMTLE